MTVVESAPRSTTPNQRMAQALAFSAATLFTIWCVRGPWLAAASVALLIAAFVMFWINGETTSSLGLAMEELVAAVVAWKWSLVILALALLVVAGKGLLSGHLWLRAGIYLAWCCLQQLLYQNVVYKGMRAKYGLRAVTWSASGVLFSLVHLPNPVLVPATLIWGVVSCRLFERRQSIFALGLLQMLLSNLLTWLVPAQYHHGLRVGPHYFSYTSG